MELGLAGFEGGFDGVWAELTKVRLEHIGVLEKDRRAWLDQRVQSVEEDEAYRHVRVTKGAGDY